MLGREGSFGEIDREREPGILGAKVCKAPFISLGTFAFIVALQTIFAIINNKKVPCKKFEEE